MVLKPCDTTSGEHRRKRRDAFSQLDVDERKSILQEPLDEIVRILEQNLLAKFWRSLALQRGAVVCQGRQWCYVANRLSMKSILNSYWYIVNMTALKTCRSRYAYDLKHSHDEMGKENSMSQCGVTLAGFRSSWCYRVLVDRILGVSGTRSRWLNMLMTRFRQP